MAGRWRDPAAFRAGPVAAVPSRATRRQGVALLAVLAVVAGLVTVLSYVVKPDDARSFRLFGGSVFLADAVAPVAVDLASGQPTVRLVDASAQVGAAEAGDVGVVPLAKGTLLVDRRSGEFNYVDATGFAVKKDGGVPLPRRSGSTGAQAVAARDFAYIEQTGPTGTSVYLVGPSTVASATADVAVKPRAFVSLSQPVSDTPGSSATAGNDLWTLTGTGTEARTIRRLSLPPRSAPGATLVSRSQGMVSGPAAIASADGTIGIASRDRISVRRGELVVRDVGFTAPAGVDTVLPASNASDRLAFLLHGSTGWSVVSVRRDGTDRQGPTRLADVDPDARLVAPALSEGRLYTVDSGTGELWRIGTTGSAQREPGVGNYPVATQDGRTIEAAGFQDAYVVARGPRVVVNSPNHLMAIAVFTDGSRAPVQFSKSDAVTISSGGGAEALTRSRFDSVPDQTPDPGRKRPAPQPVSPVNNLIDCTATSQTPHIPLLGQPVPGSRSVLLNWTYPITDRTDCVPRTYVVSVRLLSGGAPAAPAPVRVDGQLGVNLTGLFPSARYEITVTAYLNGKGTSSAPIRITTGPEGPTTPLGVTAVANSSGNWTVAWRSCGTVGNRCLPAASWRVIPQFCDGGGLAGAPAPLDVVADPSSTVQPGAQLVGGTALLGRGLKVQVEGIGANGEVGEPSASTSCSTSWTPPNAGSLKLTASKPADVAVGATTSTTLSLDLGGNAIGNAGGVGATVTFLLDGPGGTQTRTATVDGKASVLTADFSGIRAGASYSASARVSPPGHPEDAVTVTATDGITPRAQWPDLRATAGCAPTSVVACTLSVKITGISTAQTGGESFGLVNDSALTCGGNSSVPLRTADFDQASWTITKANVSQLDKLYGSCTVTVGLAESSGNPAPLYFGGTVTQLSTTVDLGAAASADVQASDVTAEWSTQNGSSAKVTYNGKQDLALLTTNWTEKLLTPDGQTVCGTDSSAPTPSYVPAGDCVQPFGDQKSGWRVVLTYDDRTDGDTHTVTVSLDGGPPSYQACAPVLTAAWGLLVSDGVTVSATGDVSGCRNFAYQLVATDQSQCGDTTGAPSQTVPITCGATRDDGWTVTVTWTNPNGNDGRADPPVTGDPPPA